MYDSNAPRDAQDMDSASGRNGKCREFTGLLREHQVRMVWVHRVVYNAPPDTKSFSENARKAAYDGPPTRSNFIITGLARTLASF